MYVRKQYIYVTATSSIFQYIQTQAQFLLKPEIFWVIQKPLQVSGYLV